MARSVVRFARLIKTCRRQGRSHEEAEDLIQEALLRLHEYCRNTEVRDEDAFLARMRTVQKAYGARDVPPEADERGGAGMTSAGGSAKSALTRAQAGSRGLDVFETQSRAQPGCPAVQRRKTDGVSPGSSAVVSSESTEIPIGGILRIGNKWLFESTGEVDD
ncbi:MAG: polymerase sigma-70 domain protein [Gammaproteobacteria bacterium]|nr:polymerase sigma-70 domain protein [Gammaproteobacteria bacterium]